MIKIENSADHWKYSTKLIWDDTLVDSLDQLFKERGAKHILDPACGTGFPSLELAERGFDVTVSDGDDVMLELFKKEAYKRDLEQKVDKRSWSSIIPQLYNSSFDAVMVRGNSLVYATSWGLGHAFAYMFNPKDTDAAIFDALQRFHSVLREGGILYLDITNHLEKEGKARVAQGRVDNWSLALDFDVTYKPDQKLRLVTSTFSWIEGNCKERYYTSYLLPHERLIYLLRKAGFRDIEPYVPIKGENFYDVFLARK